MEAERELIEATQRWIARSNLTQIEGAKVLGADSTLRYQARKNQPVQPQYAHSPARRRGA